MSTYASADLPVGRVLIVAGSDSGGGAGIQADIKTATALGAYAATAITALTAQDTHGVHGVVGVEPEFIAHQMRLVLEDIGADCVKTGMLHSTPVIRTVVATLASHGPDVPLVVDPVMVAKGGARLLDEDAVGTVIRELAPRAQVLTPNLPEAEALLGRAIHGAEDMPEAARALMTLGADTVLLKGGHLQGERMLDLLATAEEVFAFEGERLQTRNTHGTGCTLASALASGIAQGMSVRDAVARAREYVRRAILAAPGFGRGHGPLDHAWTVRGRPSET